MKRKGSVDERKASIKAHCPSNRLSSSSITRAVVGSQDKACVDGLNIKEVSCGNCDDNHNHSATLFCVSSCGPLCQGCSDALHRQRALQKHVVCKIADKLRWMCSVHQEQSLQAYCLSCEKPICEVCHLDPYLHRNHETKELLQFVEDQKTLIKEAFRFVQPNILTLSSKRCKLSDELKLVEQKRQTVATSINDTAKRLIKAVADRQQQLMARYDALAAVDKDRLQQARSQSCKLLESLGLMQQELDLLQEADPLSALDACKKLLSLEDREEDVDDRVIHHQLTEPGTDVSAALTAIAHWGTEKWPFPKAPDFSSEFDQPSPISPFDDSPASMWKDDDEDLPAVEDVVYDSGSVTWSEWSGALEYEVQMVKRDEDHGEDDCDEACKEINLFRDGYDSIFLGAQQGSEVPFASCGDYAVRVRAKFKEGWGPFSDAIMCSFERKHRYPTFQGGLKMPHFSGAMKYELMLAGPFEGRSMDDAKESAPLRYKQVHSGGREWSPHLPMGGVYGYRYRTLHEDGWTEISETYFCRFGKAARFDPANTQHREVLAAVLPAFAEESAIVDLLGSFCAGHPEWSSPDIESLVAVSADCFGFRRSARNTSNTWESIRSILPFSSSSSAPSSASLSSPSSSISRLSVRIDKIRRKGVVFGFCHSLPDDSEKRVVGDEKGEYSYAADGYQRKNGKKLRKRCAAFAKGDIITIELNRESKTLSFFKNNVLQGQPFIVALSDKKLYACVSLGNKGDQVTLF